MNKEQVSAELNYRLAKAVFQALKNKDIINEDECFELQKACAEKLHPMIGELEVNSIAREKNYESFIPG